MGRKQIMSNENKYGNVVYRETIEGFPIDISFSSNPFGEQYLIVSSGDKIISGLTMEKKRDGSLECKTKIAGPVKLEKPTQARELD